MIELGNNFYYQYITSFTNYTTFTKLKSMSKKYNNFLNSSYFYSADKSTLVRPRNKHVYDHTLLRCRNGLHIVYSMDYYNPHPYTDDDDGTDIGNGDIDIIYTITTCDGDIMHGPYIEYYDNGNVKCRALYRNDMIDGEYKEYDEDDNLTRVINYCDGCIVSM